MVSVADREGDIYEIFVAWQQAAEQGKAASWVIRACQDRRLTSKEPGRRFQKMWAQAPASPLLGEITFHLPRKGKRAAREVTQTLHACHVELKPPQRHGEKLPPVTVWAVLAREVALPTGEEPVEWLLLTSEPVATFAEAEQVIAWYLARWQVEVFFRVLKSGCRIEELLLRHVERLERVVTHYMIAAWRVLWVTMLGRLTPEVPADAVFEEEEWKSVSMVVIRATPPAKAPPLQEFIRMLASLGGYLGRKGDGHPSTQTLWTGMQSLAHYAVCWQTFGLKG